MLVDSLILPECIARPGSFGGLMALYEANYIKLNQLVDALPERDGECISSTPGDQDLHVSFENRSRYTCEVRMTYHFNEGAGIAIADPDLVARVFFDARMAEVQSWSNLSKHDLLRELHGRYRRELDRRWASNIVLGKWLDFLLDKHHFFPQEQCVSR